MISFNVLRQLNVLQQQNAIGLQIERQRSVDRGDNTLFVRHIAICDADA